MDLAQHAATAQMPAWVQILSYLAVCGLLLWTQANTTRHANAREDRIMADSAKRESTYLEALLHGRNGGPGIDSLALAVEQSARAAALAAEHAEKATLHPDGPVMQALEAHLTAIDDHLMGIDNRMTGIETSVESLACQPAGACQAAAVQLRPGKAARS